MELIERLLFGSDSLWGGGVAHSVMILALAAGVEPVGAAELSNVAAGIAVRKLGTATVSVEELNCALAD